MDDLSTRLSEQLRRLRESRGLSQKALAEKSGVPRPTIAHLESGQANPTLSVVVRVAQALGVSMDELTQAFEAPVGVLSVRSLPTERTSRVRSVRILSFGNLRDVTLERLVIRAGGRIHLAPGPGAEEVLCAEKGDFLLVSDGLELALPEEHVALVRAACHCVSPLGGTLYRAAGR